MREIPEFMAPVVDFSESERYVEGLKKFSIEEEVVQRGWNSIGD